GNWGSAIAKIIGNNTKKLSSKFEEKVQMWVYEEKIEGKNLTEIINEKHENVKYLPGIKLPENIIANPNLIDAIRNSNILVFVLPHQFLGKICKDIKNHINTKTTIGVSLIKGLHIGNEGPDLISKTIEDLLGIDVSVLMGANIASEVAKELFCESTLGYSNKENAILLRELFNTKNFKINYLDDIAGVEVCGATKNVVALGCGFSDGLGLGSNTKSTIIRIGLEEMKKFTKLFFKDSKDEVYFESCGIADLITTCYAGRNYKVSTQFAKTGKSMDELETEMLNGQKLQGTLTLKEVVEVLEQKNKLEEFPLFKTLFEIIFQNKSVKNFITILQENLKFTSSKL
ncbi:predicted protein, partial [Nematostella vectensis]